ncbi:MAG TPA: TIGR03435 family protein, partial [Candidatus Acidoferrum sp.]|nr:TIGR03435 family protein [Candidatus Acidoferrum sp.]
TLKVVPKRPVVVSPGRPFATPFQGWTYTPGRVTCVLSLRDLIREAFDVKSWQVTGPDTLDGDYYALEAVMPAATTRSEAHQMLRSLLQARFQLRFHTEPKVLQAYSLIVDKGGLKVKLLEGEPQPVQFGNESGRFYGRSVSAPDLAGTLTNRSDRPVLDETGIKGRFDFDCTWTPDPDAHAGGAKMLDPDLIAALRTQVGLRLEPKRLPQDIIVVDHVEKTPTAN